MVDFLMHSIYLDFEVCSNEYIKDDLFPLRIDQILSENFFCLQRT